MPGYRRPFDYGPRGYSSGSPVYPRDPAAGNVVNDAPPDLVPRVPTSVNPGAVPGGIGIGGRYAEQLNRNRQIQNLDPTLSPTEDFWIEEIVRRVSANLSASFQSRGAWDPMRYCSFTNIPLNVGLVEQTVLQQATRKRVYLFMINTHATQRLFITYGTVATAGNGVPLEADLGFFEHLFTVPQDDIHVIANGAATTGVLVYAELDPEALGLIG